MGKQQKVFDGEGYATAYVTITATAENTPPTENAGDDQVSTLGDTVALDGSGRVMIQTLPDALSYSWTYASMPTGSGRTDAEISGSTTAHPDFTPDVVGD